MHSKGYGITTLSRQEARIIYQLALVEGRPVDAYLLATAINQTAEDFCNIPPGRREPVALARVHTTISRIRQKFGPVVVTVPGGFMLAPGSLGPPGWLDISR